MLRLEPADGWSVDQADGLRRMFGARPPQVIAFASGSEACGRTTLLVASAAALAQAGHGVLIIDENAGAHNAAAMLGLAARHDLFDVLNGERSLSQALLRAASGVALLPAARAARELECASRLSARAREHLAATLAEIQRDVGFILIDSALRRGGHLSPVALSARHIAMVVAAQGAAITEAYALVKRIVQERGRDDFQIAITRAKKAEAARAIFANMRKVAREHLNVELHYLGAARAPGDHLADAFARALPPPLDAAAANGFTLNELAAAKTCATSRKTADGGLAVGHSVL